MAEYFADTSAILKLYFREPGSDWLRSLDLRSLTISTLAIPEAASAIARRRREGFVSVDESFSLWRAFRKDVRGWDLIATARPLLQRAAGLLFRAADVPLRTLDAIQLASALEAERQYRGTGIGPLTFLTAYSRLELAARRAGLEVDNPERHGV